MTKIATALLLMLATLHAAGQDSKPGAGPGANVVPPPPLRLLGRTPVTAGALVTPGHKPEGAASMPITAPPKGTLGTMPAAGKAPVGTPLQGGEGPLGESVKAVTPSK